MTKTIDLASLSTSAACDKGYELELTHPVTHDALGVFITVLGKDSSAFKQFIRTKANERIRRDLANQRRGKEADAPTVEQAERDAVELLVACTTGWRNVEFGGVKLEFTPENAAKLYQEGWIRAQVDEAVGDLGNFMPG
jgi:hypothetical protein